MAELTKTVKTTVASVFIAPVGSIVIPEDAGFVVGEEVEVDVTVRTAAPEQPAE